VTTIDKTEVIAGVKFLVTRDALKKAGDEARPLAWFAIEIESNHKRRVETRKNLRKPTQEMLLKAKLWLGELIKRDWVKVRGPDYFVTGKGKKIVATPRRMPITHHEATGFVEELIETANDINTRDFLCWVERIRVFGRYLNDDDPIELLETIDVAVDLKPRLQGKDYQRACIARAHGKLDLKRGETDTMDELKGGTGRRRRFIFHSGADLDLIEAKVVFERQEPGSMDGRLDPSSPATLAEFERFRKVAKEAGFDGDDRFGRDFRQHYWNLGEGGSSPTIRIEGTDWYDLKGWQVNANASTGSTHNWRHWTLEEPVTGLTFDKAMEQAKHFEAKHVKKAAK
jgi:hypothetical protein